jgi:uncharacterized protein (TIGR00255 family)
MSIRSMTAFASGERTTEWGVLGCEMRAVNHRFLELGMRLPEELRSYEPLLRERVASRISRGKIELGMRLRAPDSDGGLHLNEAMIGDLSKLNLALSSRFPGLRTSLTELLQYPGVLQGRGVDPEALQGDVLALLDVVLDDFVHSREREGSKLASVIGARATNIASIAADVRTLVPQIRAGQRHKLETRLADLSQPADPGRLEQELVIWLQKLDVDEELDRLDSHLSELRRILKQSEPVGRRLDFLLQEFNREANTLGSKSVDARTSNAAVELKVLIDQIREQIQNIE